MLSNDATKRRLDVCAKPCRLIRGCIPHTAGSGIFMADLENWKQRSKRFALHWQLDSGMNRHQRRRKIYGGLTARHYAQWTASIPN